MPDRRSRTTSSSPPPRHRTSSPSPRSDRRRSRSRSTSRSNNYTRKRSRSPDRNRPNAPYENPERRALRSPSPSHRHRRRSPSPHRRRDRSRNSDRRRDSPPSRGRDQFGRDRREGHQGDDKDKEVPLHSRGRETAGRVNWGHQVRYTPHGPQGGDEDWRGEDDTKLGENYFEKRRRVRDANPVNIWPPSPERRDDSVEVKKRKKKKNGDDDDSDHRRKKKSKKDKKKSSKKSKKSKKKKKKAESSSSSSSSESASEDEDISAKRKSSLPPSAPQGLEDEHEVDEWKEKQVQHHEDAAVGPMPLPEHDTKLSERSYGGALLSGEGSAMAAYLQSGKRIPRRGEIGLTPDEITKYENVGYVMSGSRHQRMNAVRIRKENQVISAEEKHALLMFNQQEKLKKEAETIAHLKEMVAARMKQAQGHVE
ncbi:hypothetical protein HDV05_006903 [Chytridiales sp. JEL 0842]|nr:hypothetical protein HDV05_006903 [Chytridiales sp. JEL 0842]